MDLLEYEAYAQRLDGDSPPALAMNYPENYHKLVSSPKGLHPLASQHYQTMTFALRGFTVTSAAFTAGAAAPST